MEGFAKLPLKFYRKNETKSVTRTPEGAKIKNFATILNG